MKSPEDNLMVVVTSKEVTKLYKTLLEIIEDLQKDHDIMLAKVAEKAGPDFAKAVNYFTPAKHEQIRKRVLDNGNECERNLIAFLGFFDSTINVDKVNDAAKQKTVYKKTIFSPPVII